MRRRRVLASALAAALLGGCAAVAPARREAVLRIDPPVPAAAPRPLSSRLALSPVASRASASGRRYAYVDPSAPAEVRQAATLFWEEPPPVAMEQALLRGLTARLGTPVLSAGVAPGAPRRLTVQLDRFEEDAGREASAVVAFQAVLVDAGASRALLLDRRYCARAPVSGPAPSDRAAAFSAAVGRSLDLLAADLARPEAASAAQAGTC